MATLYTTLSQTKLSPDGPPPMMVVPRKYRKLIDPQQVLGLGGLIEDEEKGLRCPVRGCEEWRHSLARHLRSAHDVSVDEIREALSLPRSVGLVSTALHDRFAGRIVLPHKNSLRALAAARGKGGHKNAGRELSVAIRNLRDTCNAQLLAKVQRLYEISDRPPTQREAIMMFGYGPFRAIIRSFGSWNHALQSIGISPRVRLAHKVTPDLVYSSWIAFFDEHGRWPTQAESTHGTLAPMVPSPNAVRQALGVSTWAEIVKRVERKARRISRKAG